MRERIWWYTQTGRRIIVCTHSQRMMINLKTYYVSQKRKRSFSIWTQTETRASFPSSKKRWCETGNNQFVSSIRITSGFFFNFSQRIYHFNCVYIHVCMCLCVAMIRPWSTNRSSSFQIASDWSLHVYDVYKSIYAVSDSWSILIANKISVQLFFFSSIVVNQTKSNQNENKLFRSYWYKTIDKVFDLCILLI